MLLRLLVVLIGAGVSVAALSADLYKWIDKSGRTHYATSVPDAYKGVASKLDAPPLPSPTQAAASRARLASDKADAQSIGAGKAGVPTAQADPARVALESGALGKGCAARTQRYMDSQACFAPYRNATGGLKAEAFKHCVEVKQPKC